MVLGVNLKHADPVRAADEASYARRILGSALAAIEIGNEPDHYGIAEGAYLARFDRYARVVRAAVPGVRLAGPDAASGDRPWLARFARHEAGRREISMITFHNYPESACDGGRPTIAELLSLGAVRSEGAAAAAVVAAGRRDGVPALIDETNSAVCWGYPGVSDVYASALWAVDYALLLARLGVDGVDFHARIAGCNPYSPFCAPPHASHLVARPEFYGLRALEQVGAGAFLDVGDPSPRTLRAYALRSGHGALTVLLDNLGRAATVVLRLPHGAAGPLRETVLATNSPAGLKATGDITLGGRRISADAVLAPPRYGLLARHAAQATLRVRAHSVIIVKTG